MLQQDTPGDFILATNESHSIREFIDESIQYTDIDLKWFGKDENTYAIDKKTNKIIISIDPIYYRPSEVDLLIGDATKAKNQLGWEPNVRFKELVKIMMLNDMKKI
jgi:GDPmannose 4,6-dehydratase